MALKLPAMDSSRTDAECGHVDAENRKGKAFRCIRCAHVDDADVNAAKVMRQRALRWLALKAAGHSDRLTPCGRNSEPLARNRTMGC